MALLSIPEIVRTYLPFLGPADEAAITAQLILLQYELQPQTGKTDQEVEDATAYNVKEQLLLGAYTAYNLLVRRVLETAAGKAGEPGVAAPTVLKRAKADVVEVEYEQVKAADGRLNLRTAELLGMLKTEVCAKARALGYEVAICSDQLTPARLPGFQFVNANPRRTAP